MPGSGVLRLLRHELELIGHSAELGKRTGVHLPRRPATVDLHRGFGDADIASNLFAQATARDLNHDLALPGRFEALPEGGQNRFTLAPSTIAREAELNGIEELLITEGLRQELNGATLHRLHRHRDVAVPCDEDDRKFPVHRSELALKIETALPRPISRRGPGRWRRPADPT
jgi:hypothetical protein